MNMNEMFAGSLNPRRQQEDLAAKFGGSLRANAQAGEASSGEDYLQRWAREKEDEEEKRGFFRSLAHGSMAGVLEPFELFGADTSELKDHERTAGGSLGYALGYFASFMIPAAATYKVAGKVLKAADFIDDGAGLFVRANALRDKTAREMLKTVNFKEEALLGGLSGALLGAGMTGEGESVGQNALMGAVTGAIGDPLLAGGMKLAAGFGGRAVPDHVKETVRKVFTGRLIESVEEVDVIARGFKSADDLWDGVFANAKMRTPERVEELRANIRDLGLTRMNRLEARILQGVSDTDPLLKKLLGELDGTIQYERIERKVGGKTSYDYLVGLHGHLDPKLVTQYKQSAATGTPWWEGMKVRWRNAPMTVVRRYTDKSGEEVFDLVTQNYIGKSKPETGSFKGVKTAEVSPEPGVIMMELGTKAPEQAPKLWATWLEKNEGPFAKGDFDETFEDFIREVQGKGSPQIRWAKGGVGQEGAAQTLDTNIGMADIEKIIPRGFLSAQRDTPAMRYITDQIDARQQIAPPKVTVEVTQSGGRAAFKVINLDGAKRIAAAKALGREALPVQIEVKNIKGNSKLVAEALETNTWQSLGNNRPFRLGDVTLDPFDRPFQEMTGPEIASLRTFFVQQTARELGRIDPEGYKLLVKSLGRTPAESPQGTLATMASQSGYAVGHGVDPETGKIVTMLKDTMPGGTAPGSELNFPTEELAMEYLRRYPREMPNLTWGLNVPTEFMAPASRAVPLNGDKWADGKGGLWDDTTQPLDLEDNVAKERLNALNMSGWWRLTSMIAPLESWLREADNHIFKETQVDMGITRAVHDYMHSTDNMRKMLQKGLREGDPTGSLGIDELIATRGGTGTKSRLMGREKKRQAVALLEDTNKASRTQAAKRLGFTDDEVKVLDELENYMIRLFEEGQAEGMWNITGDEFLQHYWPVLRKKAVGRLTGKWQDAVTKRLELEGKVFDEEFGIFHDRMAKTLGEDPAFETDPFLVPMRYLRAVASQKTMPVATEQLVKTLSSLSEVVQTTGNKDLAVVERMLNHYTQTMFGGQPEHYATLRLFTSSFLKDLGIELEPKDFDKLVNTATTLNYGAFMGFRPGLAIRNLSQLMAVTLPVVQSPKAMMIGIRKALSEDGFRQARKAGAIPAEQGIPYDDVLYTSRLYDMFMESGKKKGKALASAQAARRWLETASEVGLGSKPAGDLIGREIKVMGKDVKLGFFSTMDEFNRAVSYHAMRARAEKPLADYLAGSIEIDEALQKAGVSFLGEAHELQVKRLLEGADSPEKALEYIGVRTAHETQWLYKQGAGPAWMSSGAGRLLGQYGTWPAWFAANIYRGATAYRRDPIGAARFAMWNTLFLSAVSGATALTGYDWGKYRPWDSLSWAGGPIVDYLKDWTNLLSGAGSADSGLVKAKMGFSGGEWDPSKTFEYFAAPLLPGALAFREFKQGLELSGNRVAGDGFMKAFMSTNRLDPLEDRRLDFRTGTGGWGSW